MASHLILLRIGLRLSSSLLWLGGSNRYRGDLAVLKLLLLLLVFVNELQIEFCDLAFRHTEYTPCIICNAPELGWIEAARLPSLAVNDLV